MTQAETIESQPHEAAEIRPQPEVRETPRESPGGINVSGVERQASLLTGAGLVLLGLSRRSVPGLAFAALGGMLAYRGATGHCSAYQALGLNTARGERHPSPEEFFQKSIHVESGVTINRSPEELYRFWRDFQNLPRFMCHLKSVEVLDEKRSRWTAEAPVGWSVQWEAEVINEEPNALIAWRSVGGADVDNAGSVRFVSAPGDRGSEVRVVLDYIPPAGQLGRLVARMFGEDPEAQIREDLRNFKRIMETGEIPTTRGQPRGDCGGAGRRQIL